MSENKDSGATKEAAAEGEAQAPPLPEPSFPLRYKLVLMGSLLAIAPVLAVGYQLVDVNEHAIEDLNKEVQLSALEDLGRTIDQELREAEDGLSVIGRIFGGESQIPAEGREGAAMAIVEGRENLDHVTLYRANGDLIDTIREEATPHMEMPEQISRAIRARAIRSGAVTSGVDLRAGAPRAFVVVPIRAHAEEGQQRRTTGFVAAWVPLGDVQVHLERLAALHFRNVPGSIFIMDSELRTIAHTDRERARSFASAEEEGIFRVIDRGSIRPGVAQSSEYEHGGERMLGSVLQIPGRGWYIVTQLPTSLAYASLTQMYQRTGITIAVVALLALLLGLFLARRISAPIARLTAYAQDLAARRFDSEVEVGTRDELSVLGESMRRAAKDLQASEARIREEVAIRTDLGRYIPEQLVDQIVRREADVKLGGQRKTITILFADVVGFTPLTEQRQPEEVVAVLNELFTILTEIVFKHGGTVDKFIGDCVMAIWGAPQEQEDHAERALEAAEDMIRWLEAGNATWQERFGVTVRIAIGIHTGEAVVGNIGSETRMEYTAIGDSVNVAARLEAIARPQQILVTDATKEAAGDLFDYHDAGEHMLAGRAEPLHLWEVQS